VVHFNTGRCSNPQQITGRSQFICGRDVYLNVNCCYSNTGYNSILVDPGGYAV
jgi:hypothetical protein